MRHISATVVGMFMILAALQTTNTVEARERFAVIIAVESYPDSPDLADLHGANRDAERTREVLLQGGFESRNIVMLHDEMPSPELTPTRRNILQQLDGVLRRVRQDDLVMVMTTGHGIMHGKTSYFCPSDATSAAVFDAATAQRELIPVLTVAQKLSDVSRKFSQAGDSGSFDALLVVDACRNTSTRFVSSLQTPPEGVWIISSCSEGEQSYRVQMEDGRNYSAVFSYYLAEALSGIADLIGNNNREVSLFEAFSYARGKTNAHMQAKNYQQTPELFGGLAPPFSLCTVGSLVARQEFITDDVEAASRYMADSFADMAMQVVRRIEANYTGEQASLKDLRNRGQLLTMFRDHHNQLCYVMGNYLRPALELDPGNRVAHLVRGWSFRASGMYAEALGEYHQAGDHLELYVRGDTSEIDQYLSRNESGKPVVDNNQNPVLAVSRTANERVEFGRVPVRRHPERTSPAITFVQTHSQVRIAAVEDAQDDSQWLRVAAVNGKSLNDEGWILREHLSWFPEAADFLISESQLQRVGSTTTAPSGLSQLDATAYRMNALADRLDAPARRLDQIQYRLQNNGATRSMRRIGSLPFIGGYVPSIPNYPSQYIGMAAGYARIPGNHIRTAAGYVQLPGHYTRMARGWAGATRSYSEGVRRSNELDPARDQFLRTGQLDPVSEKPVTIENRLWQGRVDVVSGSTGE